RRCLSSDTSRHRTRRQSPTERMQRRGPSKSRASSTQGCAPEPLRLSTCQSAPGAVKPAATMAGSPTGIDFSANKTSTIVKLALPTVFAMLMQSSVNVVDDVYFRHLPDQLVASNAQSALQPSLIIVWLFGG